MEPIYCQHQIAPCLNETKITLFHSGLQRAPSLRNANSNRWIGSKGSNIVTTIDWCTSHWNSNIKKELNQLILHSHFPFLPTLTWLNFLAILRNVTIHVKFGNRVLIGVCILSLCFALSVDSILVCVWLYLISLQLNKQLQTVPNQHMNVFFWRYKHL